MFIDVPLINLWGADCIPKWSKENKKAAQKSIELSSIFLLNVGGDLPPDGEVNGPKKAKCWDPELIWKSI